MITVRAMQVKDAEQVSELERMIFSQPWSYQGFEKIICGFTQSAEHGFSGCGRK